MDIKDNAVMLLAKTSLNATQIAKALGCTPAYIIQLQLDEKVKEQINDLKAEQTISTLLRQERLEAISEKAISALQTSLEVSLNMRPIEAAKVVQIIENLPGRTIALDQHKKANAEGIQTVIINLPQGFVNSNVSIEMNTNNEIVEINGRQMRSMPSGTLLQKLQQRKLGSDNNEIQDFNLVEVQTG